MIKAGLIGLGKMGLSHYSIINAHPDVTVSAVCDTSGFVLSAIEQYAGARPYKDYKSMIEREDLDCVVVSTPTSTHAEIVQFAMEQGLHVFVEKPFCLDLEDGRRLIECARNNNRVNQVGYHFRFVGAFAKMQELLAEEIIGPVYHFTAEAYGPVVLRPKGMTWRAQKAEGGGCLHDYASHAVNLIQYLIGRPVRVGGSVLKSIYSKTVEDAVYATLFLKNEVTGQLSVNWSDEAYRKMSTQVTAYGTRGKIISDRQECKIYLREEGRGSLQKGWNILYTTELTRPVYFYLRGEEYSAQIDYFVQKIKSGDIQNINSFEEAFQTDQVLEWIIQDAEQRR